MPVKRVWIRSVNSEAQSVRRDADVLASGTLNISEKQIPPPLAASDFSSSSEHPQLVNFCLIWVKLTDIEHGYWENVC